MGHVRRANAGGQAPDQASCSNRAGAGNHERTSRTQGTKPVIPRVTLAVTNPQPSTIRLRWRSSQSIRRDSGGAVPTGRMA